MNFESNSFVFCTETWVNLLCQSRWNFPSRSFSRRFIISINMKILKHSHIFSNLFNFCILQLLDVSIKRLSWNLQKWRFQNNISSLRNRFVIIFIHWSHKLSNLLHFHSSNSYILLVEIIVVSSWNNWDRKSNWFQRIHSRWNSMSFLW